MEEPSNPGKEKPPQQKTGFAKQLASCDKTTRDRAVRLLESWMTAQNSVAIQDLKKIWKGLFYCVWHSDKRHVQADVIEKLAALVRTLDLGLSLSYFQVFILTIRREWSGIDHLRLDKFYLMLRRFLHYVFLLLDSHGWEKSVTESFMRVLAEESFTANDKYPARGINLQFVDVYLAELKEFLPLKVDALGLVFEPLYCVLARVSDKVLVDRVRVNVFDVLLDHGRRLVKRRIEEREGKGNEDVVEDDDDDVQKFGCAALAMGIGNRVLELATADSTPQANRKVLYALHDEFGKLEKFCKVSEVSIFANGVRRDRGSAEDATGFGLGKGEDMAKMAEEGELDAGKKKKKVKTANLKNVNRALDDGSQQGNGIMEFADEECLDTENKVKKRKSKKAKTLMGDENLPVHSEMEIAEEGNGIMEVADEEFLDKENKVKKKKSTKAKTLMGDENLPVHSEMEIAEEGSLVTSIGLKRKSKKAKTSMDEENQPVMKKVEKAKLKKLKAAGDGKRQPDNGQEIAQKGSLEIGDVMKKITKKNIKKAKKESNCDKAEGDEDSNVGVLAKKKLKGSSELRAKRKSHMRTCEVDEAVEGDIGNSVHNEQNNGLASAGVSFDLGDSVISNLHKEFEKVAAELGENTDAESMAFESLATSSSVESKKRKRAKTVSNEVKCSPKLSSDHENGICSAGSLHSNADSSCGKMGEKSVKKVRFSLKRNIVWKPATPLPPESLRMPPSSTPRGSALKKGVPPGPIRIVKESLSPQRMRVLTLSMRKGKRKLKVTPGTKVVRKRQSYVLQTNSV